MSPRDIYLKLMEGEQHLTLDECEAGLKHFTLLTNQLAASGPAFAYATLEANSIAGKLQLFRDVCKFEALAADRESEDYQGGYRTGIVWKDMYRPGGPWTMSDDGTRTDPAFKKRCADSQVVHRRWMMGFDEGLAAKKAGHHPTPDMLCCTSTDPAHVHWLLCLVERAGEPLGARS